MLRSVGRRFNSTAASAVRQNRFKSAILAGQHQIGFWTGLKSSLVAEMISFTSGYANLATTHAISDPRQSARAQLRLVCHRHGVRREAWSMQRQGEDDLVSALD